MEEVHVDSWDALHAALFAESWDPSLQRFRSPYAFRGLSDARYALRTSLCRLGGNFEEMEHHMLRNFRKYAHREAVEADTDWHWLALAQHHGLPTRLLDWTFSPYVALHFATSNLAKYDTDGVVWAVNYRRVHELLPAVLQRALREEGGDIFTVETLAATVRNMDELQGLDASPFLLFIEPPSMDDRIVNQYSLFSLFSNPGLRLDEWLENHTGFWRKIVVPATLKWEVRDKLDQANVTERVLFPGLDGLSRWLSRHYCPRDQPREVMREEVMVETPMLPESDRALPSR